ncbi:MULTISPECIES: RDD family protein [Auritidibacter]|uniref:RDD family protein n=1 Tax=Auritidibacter TaxID=1160973 RepID=UPI000D72AD04|nr:MULTISPECIES: RDD family protein [Auritidibacter]PXA75950.1 hypothetical protein DCC24_09065 [Auritidibacter sp. NML100628]WGH87283.1 RDD family protein [Auritidibacter ignavus]WGH89571.1 RDD family protein [Auritidibacter ignavus]WHS34359.1 RDD family protein [Auritidibacter ignavus]
MSNSTSVVTGQAVLLHLNPATVFVRGMSTIIDILLSAVGLWATFVVLASVIEQLDMAALGMFSLLTVVFWFVLIPLTVETVSGGKSVGKLVFGTRVIRDDGGAVVFRHSLIRTLSGFFELLLTLGSVALISAILNDRGKRLGDMMAGTYVIHDRQPRLPEPLPTVPAELHRWAQIADVGRIPDELLVEINQYLRNFSRMTPQAQNLHTQRLLQLVDPYVSPAPPAQTPPTVYLHAVVAERRNRDYQLLISRQQSQRQLSAELNQH